MEGVRERLGEWGAPRCDLVSKESVALKIMRPTDLNQQVASTEGPSSECDDLSVPQSLLPEHT